MAPLSESVREQTAHRGHIPSPEEARSILFEFTHSQNLRKHAETVAAAMRWYARHFNEDAARWEVVGLLHDFDYEQYPTLDQHPYAGAEILRSRGISDEFILDIFAHAPHTGQARDTLLRKAIFACDELCGFIVAVALVQPGKKLAEVTSDGVLKKLKQKSFAAKVSRDDIEKGAAGMNIPLPAHVQNVITALQGITTVLGL